MSHYQKTIKRLAPDFDPRHIEAWMRLEYGTLDHLSPAKFAAETATAARCAVVAGKDESEQLACSYGL